MPLIFKPLGLEFVFWGFYFVLFCFCFGFGSFLLLLGFFLKQVFKV